MENKISQNKKGFYFTLDALFALILLLSIIALIPYTGINNTEPQYKNSYLQEDAISILSTVRTSQVNNPHINNVLLNSTYNESFDNTDTLLDTISKLWAINYTNDSKNITAEFFSNVIQNSDNFGLFFRNTSNMLEPIFVRNSTKFESSTDIVGSKQYISGVQEGSNVFGYTARAFIQKKEKTKIVYFGGYIGDGNITAVVELANATSISNISIETATNIPSTLYINNNLIQTIPASTNELTPTKVYLPNTAFQYLINGTNNFTFENSSKLLSISGGYIKIVYRTNFVEYSASKRQYLHGIQGVVNEYDSIYSPNTITHMNALLHYSVNLSEGQNETTFFLKIGNATVYNHTTNISVDDFSVNLTDANISSKINYNTISNQTIPIRAGFTEFAGSLEGEGIADVIIVQDVSGSMAWRMSEDNVGGNNYSLSSCGNLSDPNNIIFNPNTNRISLAKCLDYEFAQIILNISGNRVGFVGYENDPLIRMELNLTSNISRVYNHLLTYGAEGGTGICAGIRKARLMLQNRPSGEQSRRSFVLVMTDGLANVNCRSDQENNTVDSESCDYCTSGSCSSNYGGGCRYTVMPVYNDNDRRAEIYDNPIYNFPLSLVVRDSSQKGYNLTNGRWTNYSVYTNGFSSLGYTATIFNLTGDGKMNLITSTFSNTWPQGYYWNGAGWTSTSIVSGIPRRHAVGEIIYNFSGNNKFTLFAGNNSNRIAAYYWNNASSSWIINNSLINGISTTDMGDNPFPAVAFNVTGSGKWIMIVGRTSDNTPRAYQWNGTTWISNSSLYNNLGMSTSYASTPDFEYNLTSGKWYIISGTRADASYLYVWDSGRWYKTCGDSISNVAADQAINESSKIAQIDQFNKTYAIGFGPIEYCPFAQEELRDIAEAGNGEYFLSKNSTRLREIMLNWSQEMASLSYSEQRVNLTGNFSSKLYPNSYIEYDYEPISFDTGGGGFLDLGDSGDDALRKYGSVLTFESKNFNNSRTDFNFSNGIIVEAVATSYSGPKWTKYVSINSTKTLDVFEEVFNLTKFGQTYSTLGDPFRVNIPINLVSDEGFTNTVELKIANSSLPSGEYNASESDKIIYTLLILSNYSYSNITTEAEGCNWTVQIYDGSEENISVPGNYTGNNRCYFNSTNGINCIDPATQDVINKDAIAQATYMVFVNYLDKHEKDCKMDVKITDYFVNALLLPSVPFLQYTTAEILTWR